MTDLQFRQSQAFTEVQLIVLGFASLLLVVIYIYLKLVYAKKNEVNDGLKLLSKKKLSQQSTLYEFCKHDKKYVVFESKFGVIELRGQKLEQKVEKIE